MKVTCTWQPENAGFAPLHTQFTHISSLAYSQTWVQVPGTLSSFFSGRDDLVLLKIKAAEVRWDQCTLRVVVVSTSRIATFDLAFSRQDARVIDFYSLLMIHDAFAFPSW